MHAVLAGRSSLPYGMDKLNIAVDCEVRVVGKTHRPIVHTMAESEAKLR